MDTVEAWGEPGHVDVHVDDPSRVLHEAGRADRGSRRVDEHSGCVEGARREHRPAVGDEEDGQAGGAENSC